jgi:acyl-coenzyme A thioesterase PaaI-like protein
MHRRGLAARLGVRYTGSMDENERRPRPWKVQLVADGEWAGWYRREVGDSFELLSGPFYWRSDLPGGFRTAFRAEQRHMNGGGFMHGGCIMTFADFCLFAIARPALKTQYGVTATLNGEFTGSVYVGDLLEGTGEIIKEGGSLVFVRGLLSTNDKPVLSFSGVIKKVKPRA